MSPISGHLFRACWVSSNSLCGVSNSQKGGSLAEYAIASVKTCTIRPEGVSADEGASIVVSGYTALQSVRQAGITSVNGGSEHLNVLITGASGGVGTLVVQVIHLCPITVKCVFF